MKVLDVAWKDVRQAFRNAFALAFMFGVPILITGLFFLMFGGTGGGDDGGFSMPTTRVQIVNLDAGFDVGAGEPLQLGTLIEELFQQDEVLAYLDVTFVDDPAQARAAVDAQEAGVALIIPENLSAAVADPEGEATATLELYQDPTLTLGPGVVKAISSALLDSFSGMRIALSVAHAQLEGAGLALDASQEQRLMGEYIAWAQTQQERVAGGLTAAEPPPGKEAAASASMVAGILGLIETGMMIFYAFFTGTSSAQTILTEDEQGTLPRLFTTPTPVSTVLGGKFLATGLTILVQVVVLVLLGHLVFGIRYGALPGIALATLGLVITASTFGIFVISWVKDTRQAGAIFGGAITLTGMLGIISIFTVGVGGSAARLTNLVSLLVPQGWAMRAWQLVMEGATLARVLPFFVGMLAWSAVFFLVGSARLNRRFA